MPCRVRCLPSPDTNGGRVTLRVRAPPTPPLGHVLVLFGTVVLERDVLETPGEDRAVHLERGREFVFSGVERRVAERQRLPAIDVFGRQDVHHQARAVRVGRTRRDESQPFLGGDQCNPLIVTFADRHWRQLCELPPQEIRNRAHLLGQVRAFLPGRPAAARDAHRAHGRGHEERQDQHRDEQLQQRESALHGQVVPTTVHRAPPSGKSSRTVLMSMARKPSPCGHSTVTSTCQAFRSLTCDLYCALGR